MRKISISSIACASVLVGMSAMISPVYADTQSGGSHAQQTDGSSSKSNSQENVTRGQMDMSHNNSVGQSTSGHPSINHKAATDIQTVITQFEQAIKKYQGVKPKHGDGSKDDQQHKNKDTANGSASAHTANPDSSPTSHGQKKSDNTDNKDNTSTKNSTGNVYGLTNEGHLAVGSPSGASSSANSASDNNSASGSSSTQSDNSSSNGGVAGHPSDNTSTQNSSSQGNLSSSTSTSDQAVTSLQRELNKYQSATKQDQKAQAAFTQAVHKYIQALHDAAAASDTNLLSAHQKDASDALQDVQSALADQSKVGTLLTALKKAALQPDIPNMTTILAQMVKLESDKSAYLMYADNTLVKSATDINGQLN